MKLEKPIRIDKSTAGELLALNNTMLFKTKNYGALVYLKNVVIETKIDKVKQKTGWFKSVMVDTPTEYLVEIELWGYSQANQYWGTYTEEAIWWFVSNWNFSKMRADFKNLIKTPLKELGYEITKIKETEK